MCVGSGPLIFGQRNTEIEETIGHVAVYFGNGKYRTSGRCIIHAPM